MRTNEAGEIIMSPFEFRQQMITDGKHCAREALRRAGLDVKQITKAKPTGVTSVGELTAGYANTKFHP